MIPASSARRLEGIALVLLSGCSFATLGIFNRLCASRELNVLTVLTLRFSVAALVLWALTLPRQRLALPARKLLGLAAMGALFVLEAGFFFVSSRRIPVALTALLLYLYPALVMLLAWLLRGEHPGRTGLLALLLALAGIGLAVGFPAQHLDGLGLALGLCSSLGYAVYMLLGARLQRGLPALVVSTWISTWAALIFLALGLGSGALHPVQALAAWLPILGLAVFGTVLPVVTLMAGLARISATEASIASTVEPIAAALMAALFLGETLRPIQLAGGGLVLAAVLLLSMANQRG